MKKIYFMSAKTSTISYEMKIKFTDKKVSSQM